MAIVRHFGRPTSFIMFTANPKWKEIVEELLAGENCSRPFRFNCKGISIKQHQFLHDIGGNLYRNLW